ncbi:PREDICTED: uncharacterized protein LOC109163135 [Ipomoea nil]|uniref:uncharacterized protein LOC109163135 n=1 Tax=Ipomoea nil TaxID=35883 RepID=UPI000901D6EC|nr:PREDICTED: uncharacterized protein LOC109163135 [Ipomoea nil]
MWCGRLLWLGTILLLTMTVCSSQRSLRIDEENGVKVETLLSPRFELEPGSVCNKFFYGIDFPRGHIGVRGFDAEVVDEEGNSIPLHETYLHHWVVGKLMIPKGVEAQKEHYNETATLVWNSGVCAELPQYFGLGSETRKTDTHIPDGYGIEIGNPPPGFGEGWLLNVHAIDTRGAEDKMGCIECRCEMYNVTEDEYGMPIGDDYVGGLRCCYDGGRCRVKGGFRGEKRGLYLKYTVTYVDWNPSIVPVKVYLFDVTDTLESSDSVRGRHRCQIEYRVDACSAAAAAAAADECVHSKSLTVSLPKGGDLIYAVAHQHVGGAGSTLFGEDGRVLCDSFPIYGNGTEAGNEDGYLVGMSTCYPQPGSVKIAPMEKLTIISNYSNVQMHTGVMGYYYILVAEPLPKSNPIFHSLDVADLV